LNKDGFQARRVEVFCDSYLRALTESGRDSDCERKEGKCGLHRESVTANPTLAPTIGFTRVWWEENQMPRGPVDEEGLPTIDYLNTLNTKAKWERFWKVANERSQLQLWHPSVC